MQTSSFIGANERMNRGVTGHVTSARPMEPARTNGSNNNDVGLADMKPLLTMDTIGDMGRENECKDCL